MKIVHFVHQYLPDYVGGTELHTREVAQRQAASGHDVHVLCPSTAASDGVHATVEDGVTVHRVGAGSRGRSRVFFNSFYFPQLAQAVDTVIADANLVHIQHLMGLPLSVVDQCRNAGVPYVITLHDYWFPCANAQLLTNFDQTICAGPDERFHNCGRCALARIGIQRSRWLAYGVAPLMGYRRRQLQPVFAGAAQVIAPTQFVYDIYRQNGFDSDNLRILRHGIDVPLVKIEVAKRNAIKGTRFHVVFVGSIARQKGVHVLLEALRQLPDVQLTVAGGLDSFPEYVTELREISAESPNISLIGRIPHDDVWPLLASADVVVLPTLWYEASPLTIDEFFAVGVPIIASDIGAMSEKIRHRVDGVLVPPNDPAALKNAIEQLAQTPVHLQQMRQNIRPVRTMETYVVELEAVYEKVLGKPIRT